MPPPFTRRQALENARFLEALGQTGNARLAARHIGRAHSTMFERRARHAAFAQGWDAALAAAHARFHLGGGKRGPEPVVMTAQPPCRGKGGKRKKGDADAGPPPGARPGAPPPACGRSPSAAKVGVDLRVGEDLRTRGGEAVVVRTRSGKLQLLACLKLRPSNIRGQGEQETPRIYEAEG